jgi:thiol-disulfide isomerase/thioredoxin
MDSTKNSDFSRRPSRRAVLETLGGIAAMPFLDERGSAQQRGGPPAFETARYQFTLLRPSVDLGTVQLTDLKGKAARLMPIQGKVLLINLWATWCDACRVDLPMLERFHAAMGNKVSVAAVPTDTSDRDKIRSFLDRISIRRLPVLLDPDRRLASPSGNATAPLAVYGMPITYLIDASGRIAGYILGSTDWLSEDAQRLLAYYAASD